MSRLGIRLPTGRFLPGALVLAVGVCATALAVGAYEGRRLGFLEFDSVDARFAVRGRETPPRKLVLVLVDESSLARLPNVVGTFIPRSLHAQVIRRIARDHPAVIAYDYTFDTPSPTILRGGLRDDNLLVDAVAAAKGKVVLASDQVANSGGPITLGFDEAGLRTLNAHAGSTAVPNQTMIRRLPFVVDGVVNFAIVAAEVAQGRTVKAASFPGKSAWIDFYGPPGTIRSVSFLRVYQGRVPVSFFKGDVVVVGASAPSLLDLHPTSTSGQQLMSGPEINANAIETVMRSLPLQDPPQPVDVGLIVLLGMLVPIVNLRFRLHRSLVVGLVAAVAFSVATQLAFNRGSVLPFVYPMGALAVACVGVLGARYALTVTDPRFVRIDTVGVVVGSEVAGYRIERLLGRGGGGSVYLATETALRRKIALKVLNPELADDEGFRKRFLHESQLAAALDHPNVVPIYRAGEEAGYLYIAMKFVRGSLASLLRRDIELDLERALTIVDQVASALDAGHAVGLIHRDVTPSNILLDPPANHAERAYLADFGLTKHHGLTSATGFVGKPDYVAPEQIRGDPVDGHVDIYSLACVLYECITGEPPFADASEITIIGSHLSRAAIPVSKVREDLPAALDDPICKALAKDPSERYDSCGEFVAAVRAATQQARPSSLPTA